MSVIGDLDLEVFNLFDPADNKRFDERAHALQAQGQWLVRTMLWHSVIGYQAVRDLQRDPRLQTWGTLIFRLQGVSDGPTHDLFARLILNVEGADHARLRRLVARAFTMAQADRMRPMMRAHLLEPARAFARNGGGDAMSQVIDDYPVAVLCEILGVPATDWPRFASWVDGFWSLARLNLAADRPAIEASITDMQDYIRDLIEARRRSPRADLLGELLTIEEAGDRLSYQELCDLVAALILAGIDSVRAQIGQMLLLFAARPDQWRRVQGDPSLIPQAVEESVRFGPGVTGVPRVVVEEFTYEGVTFPVGTMLALLCGAANRDPSVVRCPMDFDVAADRGTFSPVTFGGGAHRCLGASLARAELHEALRVLTEQWAPFELAGDPVIGPNLIARGPIYLPLAVTSR